MLQEDSNGETSFEIIDKKYDENQTNSDKTESLSSVSSAYSIPSPSIVNMPGGGAGNLLSNVQPPSSLPDFTLWQTSSTTTVAPPTPLPVALIPQESNIIRPTSSIDPLNIPPPTAKEQFPQTQFSAAIPPSKGVQHGPIITQNSVADTSQISGGSGGGGLIGWMKEAVSSGGILSKVAEKAKNSVDSIITTLDPQMSEFIYSGGDLEIIIASQDNEEIIPIREAIHLVFGKAWVNGIAFTLEEEKYQAINFDEGVTRAEKKIKSVSQIHKLPIVAIENILLNHNNDNWYDLSVLILKDLEKNITIKTFTQTTPIPIDFFVQQAKHELSDFLKTESNNEKVLSTYLPSFGNEWQQNVSGVSRRETIFLAAKALAKIYKNKLVALSNN